MSHEHTTEPQSHFLTDAERHGLYYSMNAIRMNAKPESEEYKRSNLVIGAILVKAENRLNMRCPVCGTYKESVKGGNEESAKGLKGENEESGKSEKQESAKSEKSVKGGNEESWKSGNGGDGEQA